eukprot:43649_1
MEALSDLLLFRDMADKLSIDEFNIFQQEFCKEIDRVSFLQILFVGLNELRSANSRNIIGKTTTIARQIIDSREASKSPKSTAPPPKPIHLCSLPSQIIQFIGTYLSLQNVLKFEKTNRFIAHSLLSPLSVQSITQIDNDWIHKWLLQRVPIELVSFIENSCSLEYPMVNNKNVSFWMENDLKRFSKITSLYFHVDQYDRSTYLGRAFEYIKNMFDSYYNYDRFDRYFNDTICAILKIFKCLKHLELSANTHWPLINTGAIYIISNNSSTLESLILKNHFPLQLFELFQTKSPIKTDIMELTQLQHFALIDINHKHANVDEDGADGKESNWDADSTCNYSNPFMLLNTFLMHFLPNICLSNYDMYPPFNAISKEYKGTDKDYIANIDIPQCQVPGYKYLTIDNSNLVFREYAAVVSTPLYLETKILELFQNTSMVKTSFQQIQGISALNLNVNDNTYHLIKTILAVHANKIESLHVHNMQNMNAVDIIKCANVKELCLDVGLSRAMDQFYLFTKLQRLHIILESNQQKSLSKYCTNLSKIINSNLSFEYLGIAVCVKHDEKELDNLLKMLQNVCSNITNKNRKQFKMKLNVIFLEGVKTRDNENVTLCGDEIQKLFTKTMQISNGNAMLLFDIDVAGKGLRNLSSVQSKDAYKLQINTEVYFNENGKLRHGEIKERNETKLKLEMYNPYHGDPYGEFEWIDHSKIPLMTTKKNPNQTHQHVYKKNDSSLGLRSLLYSFALSNQECRINGYAEHWNLYCNFCSNANKLLTYTQMQTNYGRFTVT